jgi:hypothetical protein
VDFRIVTFATANPNKKFEKILACQTVTTLLHNSSVYIFFLGGRDLEMLTIAALLKERKAVSFDKQLAWGAKASDYATQIQTVLREGKTPVLIELQLDLPADELKRCKVIDHHGNSAGELKPTALHQVFALLGLPSTAWTRQLMLVAANDRGYIPEMLREGATPAEVAQIRLADRQAQGVTLADEANALQAIASKTWHQTDAGRGLWVVQCASDRVSPVADRLFPIGSGANEQADLLICSPKEYNFFGAGTRIELLHKAFGGWKGGALPTYGFWGAAREGLDFGLLMGVLG